MIPRYTVHVVNRAITIKRNKVLDFHALDGYVRREIPRISKKKKNEISYVSPITSGKVDGETITV